jgi:hypothetical protein
MVVLAASAAAADADTVTRTLLLTAAAVMTAAVLTEGARALREEAGRFFADPVGRAHVVTVASCFYVGWPLSLSLYALGREGVGVLTENTSMGLWALLSIVTHVVFGAGARHAPVQLPSDTGYTAPRD